MEKLNEKIIDLFDYRILPELIRSQEENETKVSKFLRQLIQLQKSIYYLDAQLESIWDLSEEQLRPYWDEIHTDLLDLGVSEEKLEFYCRHIRKYQHHELQLRKGLLPTRLNVEYFYFYKSCDVKLLRRLIYDRYPGLEKTYRQVDWRIFDLITEIDDDVEDLFEDTTVFNGNSVIFYLHQNGAKNTIHIFSSFLADLRRRNDLKAEKNLKYSSLQAKCSQLIEDTDQLLKTNVPKFIKSYPDLEQIKILQHIYASA